MRLQIFFSQILFKPFSSLPVFLNPGGPFPVLTHGSPVVSSPTDAKSPWGGNLAGLWRCCLKTKALIHLCKGALCNQTPPGPLRAMFRLLIAGFSVPEEPGENRNTFKSQVLVLKKGQHTKPKIIKKMDAVWFGPFVYSALFNFTNIKFPFSIINTPPMGCKLPPISFF